MDFNPSKADPDIWMKSSKDGTHYKYIAVYVDDLTICMKDPQAFCDTLKKRTSSSSKALDHSAIILVLDIPDMKAESLLQIQGNMLTRFLSYMRKCFGKPKKTRTPLVAGDHPEIDLSEFCDKGQIKQYQPIVGQ